MTGLPTGDGLAVVDVEVDKKTAEPVGKETVRALWWEPLLERGLHARTPSGRRATRSSRIG